MFPEFVDLDTADRLTVGDFLAREEPDEEDDEDNDDEGGEQDDDEDDGNSDGYSE